MKCTCCINFNIIARFLLGIFVTILYELHLLGIELVVTQTTDLHNSTCFYYVNDETVSLYWLILPKVLIGIATYIILTSSLEFIASQAPYSMRGLLLGIGILLYGLSTSMSSLCYLLVNISRKYYTVSNGSNCELWLYGCILFLTIVLLCTGFIFLNSTLLGEEMKICPTSRNLQWITMKNIFHKFLNKLDLISFIKINEVFN